MRHAICGPVGRGVSAWNSVGKCTERLWEKTDRDPSHR